MQYVALLVDHIALQVGRKPASIQVGNVDLTGTPKDRGGKVVQLRLAVEPLATEFLVPLGAKFNLKVCSHVPACANKFSDKYFLKTAKTALPSGIGLLQMVCVHTSPVMLMPIKPKVYS